MKAIKTKQVALYARVSTKDKGQDVENQLAQLREFCERQGYAIHGEYMDDESGTKGKREREGFNRLFEDASKRKFLSITDSVDMKKNPQNKPENALCLCVF